MPGDRWTTNEKNVLRRHFEAEGADGCMARMKKLERRGAFAIKQVARKLGLREPRPHNALIHRLAPDQVEKLIRLHDEEHLGFKPIGDRLGVCESTASNAYYAAMCPRRGYRPAERDAHGHLLPAEIERLRAFLRKGTKAVDIQLFMAISAGAICNERRQYNAELRARGKRPLPPPGNGERYSGARIPREVSRAVGQEYLAGHATPKVSAITGVSKTHCLRIRSRLIRRLRRQGVCLAGCDINGKRITYPDTILRIPDSAREELRRLILDRVPISRAALKCGIGGSSAYKIRDELRAELAARGEQLPPPIRPASLQAARRLRSDAEWLPKGRAAIIRFRRLLADYAPDEAKRRMLAEISTAAEQARCEQDERRRRPLTFEEQLERVRNGAGIVERFTLPRTDPGITLGGVASSLF